MRINKTHIANSIQNYREAYGKFYIVLEDENRKLEVEKLLVKRKYQFKDANKRLIFNHKDRQFAMSYDLDRHLVCQHHYFFSRNEQPEQTLMFKNYWFAHAFKLRMQRKRRKK